MDNFLPCNPLDLNDKDHEGRASSSSLATEDSGYSSIFRTVNSVRVYSSKDEYLIAMIEDLGQWIRMNHFVEINIDNFFDCLENGVILCKQAQMVQFAGERFIATKNNGSRNLPGRWSNCQLTLPNHFPKFTNRHTYQTFIARDNIANFIGWLRMFGFSDSIMFETEDLISRKNIRHVVLALLELARVGGLFGLNVPNLIELEQEIDAEILSELESAKVEKGVHSANEEGDTIQRRNVTILRNEAEKDLIRETFNKQVITPKPYFPECDIRSLDEMVREILLECECMNQFPMTRLSEGKYLFGEKDSPIFVRILRSHVMVRVGGGWDTLNHLLYKHDPCRKDKPEGTVEVAAISHRDTKVFSNGFTKSNSATNNFKSSINYQKSRDTKSAEIDDLSVRLTNIPSSFNQGKSSSGKVKRRSSLQPLRKPDIEMTLKERGSKIPILCKNLRVIKEVPLSRKQIDLLEISDTSSAPCSRRQSPVMVRHLVPWK